MSRCDDVGIETNLTIAPEMTFWWLCPIDWTMLMAFTIGDN